jgi:serine/threonine-protein kinase
MTEAERRICDSCGASIPTTSRFCPSCGAEVIVLKTGEILDGKYEILGKLGEGGMGEVYRARHVHLDEVRIIKLMKPGAFDDNTQQRRFAEEARLATVVRHPNVAALYDFARLPSGAFYMVWEFIDGATLLQRVRRGGKIPPEEAIDIALQVLSGLAEIHRAGVVHRDLSPDNIMMVEKDGFRRVKIIDLGIAKRVAEKRLGMTATGMFLGKVRYCSPEQAGALHEGETLDGRSDIYSFGAVLYEMLSGKPLFESPTPEGYIVKHLQQAPPRLTAEDVSGPVGDALSGIIGKALEKDRRRRFASAEELAAALAGLRSDTRTMRTMKGPPPTEEPTRAIPTGEVTLAAPQHRSTRLTRSATLLAVLVGALALGYAEWRSRGRRSEPEAPAPRPAVSATSSPDVAPAVPDPRIAEEEPAAATEESAPPARHPRAASTPSPVAPTPPVAPPPFASPPPAVSPPASPAAPDSGGAQRNARAKYLELTLAAETGNRDDVRALVAFGNDTVETHPEVPIAGRIRKELPPRLLRQARRAASNKRFARALACLEAYKELRFAPPEEGLDEWIARLQKKVESRGEGPPRR